MSVIGHEAAVLRSGGRFRNRGKSGYAAAFGLLRVRYDLETLIRSDEAINASVCPHVA